MTLTLALPSAVEESLTREAVRQGVPLDTYALRVLESTPCHSLEAIELSPHCKRGEMMPRDEISRSRKTICSRLSMRIACLTGRCFHPNSRGCHGESRGVAGCRTVGTGDKSQTFRRATWPVRHGCNR